MHGCGLCSVLFMLEVVDIDAQLTVLEVGHLEDILDLDILEERPITKGNSSADGSHLKLIHVLVKTVKNLNPLNLKLQTVSEKLRFVGIKRGVKRLAKNLNIPNMRLFTK